MPRPSKYSKEILEALCKWIRSGNTYKDACMIEGISYQTFNEWRNAKPEFSDAIKKAEAMCKAVRIALVLKAGQKSWQAAAWYLERRFPEEYGRPKQSDHRNHAAIEGADRAERLVTAMIETVTNGRNKAKPSK